MYINVREHFLSEKHSILYVHNKDIVILFQELPIGLLVNFLHKRTLISLLCYDKTGLLARIILKLTCAK